MKPMQILILSNHSGGLYDFRKDLIKELKKYASVSAVTPRNGRWEELNSLVDESVEVSIDRRGMNPVRDFKLFRQYQKILGTAKPDLVITYTIKPNIYGGLACRMAKIPYAVNITGLGSAIENGGLLKKFVLMLYKPALKKAKVVFFENAENRNILVNSGVVPKGKDFVLNGAGVSLTDFPCRPYPPDETVRFLFVGRVMKEKGIDEFFSAAEKIKSEFGTAAEFHIAGSFEEAYKPLMDKLEQKGIVKYHGYQSDMKPLYAAAHCVVLPSYHEGMSNVLLEGAACGRPLITSNISGCKEAVRDGKNGFLCPVKDTDGLAATMKRFILLSPKEKAEMGAFSRKLTEENFDKEKVVKETVTKLEIANG